MNEGLYAAVAFIFLSIRTGKHSHEVISVGRHMHFEGEVSAQTIRVHGHEGHVEITGHQSTTGLNLYDHHSRSQLLINFNPSGFSGYHQASQARFQGSLVGESLSIHDPISHHNFSYQLG